MSSAAIRFQDVTKTFDGKVVAVDGVTLDIAAGEFFSLLGPSGCGKTTTLRLIAGFERPTSGDVRLDGTTVARARELGLDLRQALLSHRSAEPLAALGDLIDTGATGTNVNDLIVLAVGKADR